MIYSLGITSVKQGVNVFVAPSADVIGSVILEDESSVWFNAVLRGDEDTIVIGRGSNIQDGSVIHTDHDIPVNIEDHVTVGHKVMLHGCRIGSGSLIGINSVILNHAVIGRHCLIGANSLVTEGKIIPDRSLVMGSPAKVVRELNDDEATQIRQAADSYIVYARRFAQELKEQN